MCDDCWDWYGRPKIYNPAVQNAVVAYRRVYEFSSVGGHLHIVLDDWNLEDEFLDFCEQDIDKNQADASPAQLVAEMECLAAFYLLSEDGRASALAIAEGIWQPQHGAGA